MLVRVPARPGPRHLLRSIAMVGAALHLLAGCSGGAGSAAGSGAGGSGGDRARVGGGDPARSGPLTEVECLELLDHYLDLAMAEKRATLPPEQVPTAEQVDRIRLAMRDEARQACVGRGERGRYDCAMRARTTRGLGVCLTDKGG
jgi:hypothetical protein